MTFIRGDKPGYHTRLGRTGERIAFSNKGFYQAPWMVAVSVTCDKEIPEDGFR